MSWAGRVNNSVPDPRSEGRKGGRQRKMGAKIKEPLCQAPFLPQNAQRGPPYAPCYTACSSGFCLHWLYLSICLSLALSLSLSPSFLPFLPLSHTQTLQHTAQTHIIHRHCPQYFVLCESHTLSHISSSVNDPSSCR